MLRTVTHAYVDHDLHTGRNAVAGVHCKSKCAPMPDCNKPVVARSDAAKRNGHCKMSREVVK